MAESTAELSASLASMSGVELLRAMASLPSPPPNIGSLIGMEVGEIGEGRVVFELSTRPDHSNPLGSLHGGIAATLLDSVMGCAVHSALEAGVGYGTLELKVNYIRAVPTDGVRLTATGTVIHLGRTTATAEGRIVDSEDRLVAHGTTTCIVHR
jgi:uncharacterized protein (TIGR00369 family)